MEIGSIGTVPNYSPTTKTPGHGVSKSHGPEARESGPDRDNDGDEGKQVAASPAASAPGRVGAVDLTA